MHETQAPPLATRFQAKTVTTDEQRDRQRRRLGRWTGLGVGLVWAGVLLGVLLGLGRVPWLEAALWSTASGIVFGRATHSSLRFTLQRMSAPRRVEIGITDLQGFRQRLTTSLVRLGYHHAKNELGRDRFEHRWDQIMPPVRVSWVGAGAVLEGPRWALRRAMRHVVD